MLLPSTNTLAHRPFTWDEAQCLHNELKTTPNILGYTPGELRQQKDVFVATDASGNFAGACFSKDLPGGWTEISVVYVLPAYRGAGLGGQLLATAWERAVGRGRRIYMMSRNAGVIAWMREKQMHITPAERFWHTPLSYQLYSQWYMTSWHRLAAVFRKGKEIRKCPPLVQGVWKQPASSRLS